MSEKSDLSGYFRYAVLMHALRSIPNPQRARISVEYVDGIFEQAEALPTPLIPEDLKVFTKEVLADYASRLWVSSL